MARNEADFGWPGATSYMPGSVSFESATNPGATANYMSSNLLEQGTSPLDIDPTSRDVKQIFEEERAISTTILTGLLNPSVPTSETENPPNI